MQLFGCRPWIRLVPDTALARNQATIPASNDGQISLIKRIGEILHSLLNDKQKDRYGKKYDYRKPCYSNAHDLFLPRNSL